MLTCIYRICVVHLDITDYPKILLLFSRFYMMYILDSCHVYIIIYIHYHNSNLIWRTVARRVDEVIPSDHLRRVASRVIQSLPHPRDMILYARSSDYYDNMFIICLFSDILSDFKTCFGL